MGWLKEISYGFHEVKLYLATQVFDHARHVEAFRKRALANGGGLGVQTPGFFNRTVYASFKFTELIIYMNIIRAIVPARGVRDGRQDRPLAGGPAALRADRRTTCAATWRSASSTCATTCCMGDEQKRRNVRTWLERGEIMMAADLKRDTPLREAFILALGDTVAKGKEGLKELRQAQLKRYLQTLEAATYRGHGDARHAVAAEVIETP